MHRSAYSVSRPAPANVLSTLRALLPTLELVALLMALSLFWGLIAFIALPS